MGIVKYILCLFFFFTFGCVDIIPLTTIVSGDKIFVLCEVEAGKRIEADIYFAGDVDGKKIKRVTDQDLEALSLAEGDKDTGFEFEYDNKDSIFYIDSDKFEIKSGLTYRFLGVGKSTHGGEPNINMPHPITLDTFQVLKYEIDQDEKIIKTNLQTSLILPRSVNKSSYFYIILTSENNAIWSIDNFEYNAGSINKLSQRAGFLVDYSKVDGNEIRLNISISESLATSAVNVRLYNVTESFYRYNLYASNIITASSSFNIHPPIAGFNIQTDKAIGSFSALSGTSHSYKIR